MKTVKNNLCCRYASHLLDDILRTRSSILSLSQLNNLPQLVTQMSDHQLANFCRVLYFVLTDAEACEDRNTCKLLLFYYHTHIVHILKSMHHIFASFIMLYNIPKWKLVLGAIKCCIIILILTVLNQDTNKRFQERADVADNNQGILLSIAEFLPRVCALASESMGKHIILEKIFAA
mgnify:CR=1 FL=1